MWALEPLWTLEPCGPWNLVARTMRTGRPVEAARHGVFRARGDHDYVAGYRGVKLADPEGNRMMLAARQCWLDAADCGELGAAK
jgi:hypothetical protein